MESQNSLHFIENNDVKESEQGRLSRRSGRKDSALSRLSGKRGKSHDDADSSSGGQLRTRTRERDPDQDRASDGDHSSASFYSDEYENASLSDRSFSPRSPSPSPPRGGRARRVSSGLLHPTGVRKGASRRPGPQASHSQRSSGLRSQILSKDAPPKDLDLVTKRLLSARLLKISELKNTLSELQQRIDELQRENRLLRQLQLRQEKALHRYDDTESEISQLISRHNNETHALRERLRRSQEKERTLERRCKEADAQLQRCRDQLHKLQQLADEKQLCERHELTTKLKHTQFKAQESERRVKELEKNIELSTGSFQRQLASERKKTHDALQDVQALREEVDRLSAKLKERERELDARNIYANRMRGASKKDLEDPTKRKGSGICCSKAVQTEDGTLSLDFPSPPLAANDGSEFPSDDKADDYLTLKELQSAEPRQKAAEEQRIQELEREQEKERAHMRAMEREREREREKEREGLGESERELEKDRGKEKAQLSFSEEKGMGQRNGWDREECERKRQSQQQNEIEKWKQEEEEMRQREIRADQERAEEERRRKELLLAKMHEIDMQAQGRDSGMFQDETTSARSPHRFPKLQNQNPSILSFTEPSEYLSTSGAGKRGGGPRSQKTGQDLDLTFGSYAPSFGKPAPRSGLSLRTSGQTLSQAVGEGDGMVDLNGVEKERKSNLMQQLFGSSTSSPVSDPTSKTELMSSSSTKPRSVGPSARRRDTETPPRLIDSSKTTLHSHNGLAVKAIAPFDDDIEELAL